jgi:folate-binding protein YgfZ
MWLRRILLPLTMIDELRFSPSQFSIELNEIIFNGTDVKEFLQNQCTNDINLISPGEFLLVSFLDPQGRIESYGWLVCDHLQQFRLWVAPALLENSIGRLNRFLVSEDVEIVSSGLIKKTVLITPFEYKEGFQGVMFDHQAYFIEHPLSDVVNLKPQEVELWRVLSGSPNFSGADFTNKLITNSRLFDLSVSLKKGCYPGQETVSKISTNRGSAYFPVLLQTDDHLLLGDIFYLERKIGSVEKVVSFRNTYYASAYLLRDFRVDQLSLNAEISAKPFHAQVIYYPLIKGDKKTMAQEAFYLASENFKNDLLIQAEEKFKQAIALDPEYADALEGLGVMLGRQERFSEATECMNKLLLINPSSVLAHTNLSLFLMRMGRIEEAEEQKNLATVKSFQAFGDEAKRKKNDELNRQQKLSEWSQRENMFRQVLEIDPEDTLANYGLGSIAIEKADWENARIYLEKVLAQDKKYSVAYLGLGKALSGLKLYDKAIDVWKEGIKISASNGDLMPANSMQEELRSLSLRIDKGQF